MYLVNCLDLNVNLSLEAKFNSLIQFFCMSTLEFFCMLLFPFSFKISLSLLITESVVYGSKVTT